MLTLQLQQIIDKLKSEIPDSEIYSTISRQIRVDIKANNVQLRKDTTTKVLSVFEGDSKVENTRPFDVILSNRIKILIKPGKGTKKTGSKAYYGNLEKYDLTAFDLSAFSTISGEFTTGRLPSNIKESSDVTCVSDLNTIIEKNSDSLEGINITTHGFTFKNVVGCIPVTNGEPKADVVFVCKKDNKLYPDGYISYKLGSSAKDFQNYSGLSDKSAPFIFNHKETAEFYTKLNELSTNKIKQDLYQPIQDKRIISMSVWGKDYGKGYGVDNVHFLAQGTPSLSGSVLTYTHIQKNGDLNFGKDYEPVFGARYAAGRNNRGPKNIKVNDFRIGIFPRAYRTNWMK